MKFGCGRNIKSPQRSIGYAHFKPKRTPNPSFPCPSQKHNSFNISFIITIGLNLLVFEIAVGIIFLLELPQSFKDPATGSRM